MSRIAAAVCLGFVGGCIFTVITAYLWGAIL